MAKQAKRTKKFLAKAAKVQGDGKVARPRKRLGVRKPVKAAAPAVEEKEGAKVSVAALLASIKAQGRTVKVVEKRGGKAKVVQAIRLRPGTKAKTAEKALSAAEDAAKDADEKEEEEEEEEKEEDEAAASSSESEPDDSGASEVAGGSAANGAAAADAGSASHSGSDSDSDSDELDLDMDMDRLAKEDPDFYQFLKENDEDLLAFGKDEEDAEDGADDGEAPGFDEPAFPGARSTAAMELTPELLDQMVEGAFKKHSLRALRNLVGAFRQACTLSGAGDDDDGAGGGFRAKYELSEEVVEPLVEACLAGFRPAFDHHTFGTSATSETESRAGASPEERQAALQPYLGLTGMEATTGSKEQKAAARAAAKTATGNWKALRPLAFGALRGVISLVGKRGVTSGDPRLMSTLLDRFRSLVPYFLPFPRLAKTMLKSLLGHWSRGTEHLEDADRGQVQLLRMKAYLGIWDLSTAMPHPFLDLALKGAYLTYARRSRSAPASGSVEALSAGADKAALQAFMASSIVELYGLDLGSSYQHGFLYIRQLAIHLRTAYAKKTKDAFSTVLSWQFLSSLRVWTLVLAAYPGPEELQPLVYPLTQVIQGTMRLLPTSRYLPLRLHCVRLLQQLAAAAGLFCPTAMLCLEMLESPDLRKKPVPSTAAPPNLHLLIRLGGGQASTLAKDRPLATHGAQSAVVAELLSLLEREIEIYRCTLAVPEYLHGVTQRLRAFAKASRTGLWRTLARGVADKAEMAGKKAAELRTKLHISPAESPEIEALRPPKTEKASARLEKLARKQQAETHALLGLSGPVDAPAPEASTSGPARKKKKSKKGKRRGDGESAEGDAEGEAGDERRANGGQGGATGLGETDRTAKRRKSNSKGRAGAEEAAAAQDAVPAVRDEAASREMGDEVGDIAWSDQDSD